MTFLRVSPVHELWFEEHGNPLGMPVVCLHGGPGAGLAPSDAELFDRDTHRIVLFDQRGCGKSRPTGSLEENTTWHLVEDLEKLREHLGIRDWMVFGASWGSTLALAYAQEHPTRVSRLLLRGVFLMRHEELVWFYERGASFVLPEEWERFDRDRESSVAWARWESIACTFQPSEEIVRYLTDPARAELLARLESHYFTHAGWLEEGQLLTNIGSIRHIPCNIVHGRYDLVCPLKSAWDLHRAWPEAILHIVEGAGHLGPEITATLRDAAVTRIESAGGRP